MGHQTFHLIPSHINIIIMNTDIIYFNSKSIEPYNVFSNFYLSKIIVDSQEYLSVEHYYQSMKFTDEKIRNDIINTNNPAKVKKKALSHKCNIKNDWDDIKIDVMEKGVCAKITQNKKIGRILKNTKDKQLFELSTKDMFWGVVIDENGSRKGTNNLGNILMKLRYEL
jgi:ribA/ribD-fused uncharacterized protein